MAYDPDETRRRILGAATDEFSARGLAGARVDRIAAAAGCSKERLYANFGDKESLFTTVLNHSFAALGEAAERAGRAGSPVASAADFAVAIFDHLAENPENQRLLSWARLEDAHDWEDSFAVLAEVRDASTGQLARLGVGSAPWPVDDVFVLVLSIATAWSQLPGGARAEAAGAGADGSGADRSGAGAAGAGAGAGAPGATTDLAAQREIVRAAVARLLG